MKYWIEPLKPFFLIYCYLLLGLKMVNCILYLQLRYQKCLDAHPSGLTKSQSANNVTQTKGISATLKSFVGTLTGKKANGNS